MVWKPKAVKIDNVFLHGYDDGTDELLEEMPKISGHEAKLLYDLLSKVFVYEPSKKITVEEMLGHSWFYMDRGDQWQGRSRGQGGRYCRAIYSLNLFGILD